MSPQGEPVCRRHGEDVPMSLRSLHSDVSRPDELVGLYECPNCGDERRIPLNYEAA